MGGLYSHLIKSFLRNGQWNRNWTSRIMFFLIALQFVALFTMFAFVLKHVLSRGGVNPVETFNGFLIHYLAIDLVARIFFQPQAIFNVTPYLRFNISKRRITLFLLGRTFINLFNILPFIILFSFIKNILLEEAGFFVSINYLLIFFFLLMINNLLATSINFLMRKYLLMSLFPYLLIALMGAVIGLGFPLESYSAVMGNAFIAHSLPSLILVFSIFLVLLFFNLAWLKRFFYPTETNNSSSFWTSWLSFESSSWKDRGSVWRYISLELQLLSRNKYPRQMLLMGILFPVYMLFSILAKNRPLEEMFIFYLFLISSYMTLIYGQFVFSWESSFYDGLMSRKMDTMSYLKSKLYLMWMAGLFLGLPLTIILILQTDINFIIILACLINALGTVACLQLYAATSNTRRVELSQKSLFKSRNFSGEQLLFQMIIGFLPCGLFFLLSYFLGENIAAGIIILPGILFLISSQIWIKKVVYPRYIQKKYKMLEAFTVKE